MRIMHLCNSLAIGGAEALAVQMVSDQARRYDQSPLLTTLGSSSSTLLRERLDPKVRFVELGMPGALNPRGVWALRRLIQETRTTVVHTHNPKPLLAAAAAGAGLSVRIVYTHHGSGVIHLFSQYSPLRSWLLFRCSYFVGVSPEATLRMQESFENRIPAEKVRTILNGIDVDGGSPAPSSTPAETWEDGRPSIGYVGRLSPEKRVDLLIDAVAQLEGDLRRARLVLVGDGALREDLEQRADARGIADRVVFLGARGDVPALLRRFTLFANSSDMEGISLGILEAMAAGLPIIATAVGGTPLLVEDGRSGRLVPAGSVEDLSAAIRELLSDAGLRARLGQAARDHARAEFSFRTMMDRYEALY